jgi:hypothetical protein
MPRPTPPAAGRPSVLSGVALSCALACGLVSACTSEGSGERMSQPTPTPSRTTAAEAVAEVATVARRGSVTGRIDTRPRKDVVQRVAGVVDEWLEAAYVGGDYPRDASSYDDSTWPGFTDGAARSAAADRELMSNADIADRIDGVTVKKREITVDVLAVDRRARAATARVRLAFRTTGLERRVTVTGRVFLTKADGRWKVFGYDVAKGRAST